MNVHDFVNHFTSRRGRFRAKRGQLENVSRTLTLKPSPECGLGCLMFAIFARQRLSYVCHILSTADVSIVQYSLDSSWRMCAIFARQRLFYVCHIRSTAAVLCVPYSLDSGLSCLCHIRLTADTLKGVAASGGGSARVSGETAGERLCLAP